MSRKANDNSDPIAGELQSPEAGDPVNDVDIAGSLQRILDASTEGPLPDQEDRALLERLKKASQQMADCEFCVSPVLTRLVDVAIGGIPILPSGQYEKMCAVVANTLFDDTGARARLEQLWHRLREGG